MGSSSNGKTSVLQAEDRGSIPRQSTLEVESGKWKVGSGEWGVKFVRRCNLQSFWFIFPLHPSASSSHFFLGGQPDTVCRADLLNRKRLRCKGSNPLPSALRSGTSNRLTFHFSLSVFNGSRLDSEMENHTALLTRRSRFESWSRCWIRSRIKNGANNFVAVNVLSAIMHSRKFYHLRAMSYECFPEVIGWILFFCHFRA